MGKNEQLTQQQQKRLEQLRKQQKELKKEAQELAKQLDSLKKKKASKAAKDASQDMKNADQKMKDQKTTQAAEEQEKAEQRLNQAKREVEKEKWKYENLRQEEIIFNLSGELKELVKEQTSVYNDTKSLDQNTKKHGITRRDLIAIRRISSRQKKLVAEIDKIMKKLEKEDSQVFNWILRRIRVNMDETVKNLRRRDMGVLTQSLQKE